MERIHSFKSVTYILSGSLLYIYNTLAGSWTSGFAAIFGFVLFIKGLDMLKAGLDETGKSGVNLIRIAAIIGVIASCVDLFPLTGWLAGLGFMAAFILELIGFNRLKNSTSIGMVGKEGASRLAAAMIVSTIGAMVTMFPYFGNIAAAIFAFAAMYLVFSGWLKIQDGIMGENLALAN
ncbi:MAG: hypothetical protein ACI8P3_002865 [Saprospiraceae bacterium]|jgi:hypothetical protein